MDRLTFEFPTPGDAAYFAERLDEFAPKVSHRVVDLLVPDDPDPELVRIARDYAVLTAYRMGATSEGARGKAPERCEPLYILELWPSGDSPRDSWLEGEIPDAAVTTLAEFLAVNPDATPIVTAHDAMREGSVTGGGGASPRWRLERTAYVGRKVQS